MTRISSKHLRRREQQTSNMKKPPPNKASFVQKGRLTGLFVTDELTKALEECKSRVAEIAQDCRQKNRKFRDIEFDLENDKTRCLYGLDMGANVQMPSDVQRVTQIFEKPVFFVNGADSNDIVQGTLGDCWFLSALATISTAKGLVESFCVARDEEVGVYGFIFFRDTTWTVILIDDMLYTSIPKFEELNKEEQRLYHNDKEVYNRSARKTGKSLSFARSGTNGETWVPLIEKAYAKLHGNYAALIGGQTGEAVEELTGGVNTFISTKDILDIDKFWKEELRQANKGKLFGCAFNDLDTTRSGGTDITVNGLFGSHAYSVLRAVEYNGKRFVVIRNPWGKSEWNGPWSDGSKEWTAEWLPALEHLGHTFGNDGQFVMEYKDFLDSWEQIDRTLLFDSTWVMSSQWLRVTARPLPSAWGFGDVSFTISLPASSPAVIVLSKLDNRYFEPISGRSNWTFDFVVFRKGETKPVTMSSQARFYSRSVNAEIHLEAGDYVVHVRLDRFISRPSNYLEVGLEDWQARTYSRVLTERAKSQSIASNFNKSAEAAHLPIPLATLAGQDLSELEAKAVLAAEALANGKEKETPTSPQEKTNLPEPLATTVTDDTVAPVEGDIKDEVDHPKDGMLRGSNDDGDKSDKSDGESETDDDESIILDDGPPRQSDPAEDNVVFMGLRVYTNKASPAVVGGQLRHEMAISFAGLAINGGR